MATIFLRPLRQLVLSLTASETPRQIAWGFTLGMCIGLIPKGNLLAIALAMSLFAFRANVPAGMLAIGLFSWIGLWLDNLAHKIGSLVLTWQPAVPFHTWLYESPLGALIGTNNTAVVGHLLIAIYLSYPAYWIANRLAIRYQPPISKWLLRYRAIRWIRGAEITSHWGTGS